MQFASRYNDDVLEGQFSLMLRDGWFEDDATTCNFTLKTPFPQLQNISAAFERHGDPSATNFAEVVLDEFKVNWSFC